MKTLLALFTGPNRYPRLNDCLLLLVRLAIGSAMLYHAITKILQFSALAPSFMDPFAIGTTPSLVIAIAVQAITGLALLLGFFTRPAALLLCGSMGFAAYSLGTQVSLLSGEPAALYALFALSLFIQGSGRISLEHMMVKRYHAAKTAGTAKATKETGKEKATDTEKKSDNAKDVKAAQESDKATHAAKETATA
ncbi:DoxX family protein [Photobacterium aphoticum]|uniref:DoxX family protein n=1 Tax=Photobacterium aphoticum TaxID=754436 RepID=A0A0J1GGK0_9GAMM|nr:DoxX family protein [Photobacterium aphoticum]KLU98680.1 hypothetical protein ABT58_21285 [Photobacterium aphoticum]PSU56459.1 DoxX family protein [Photobacterium aphoticum]GHA53913.1 hypothetical protein GCM10007086_30050 [Photobacterium aphoticum]